jgi:hypothetical protein
MSAAPQPSALAAAPNANGLSRDVRIGDSKALASTASRP